MSQTQGRIAAILGPTNTGKTHYAIERMLAHRTGVIGLPLRLLAREVYDRIVAIRGPSVVALVTGEERIVPERTQYWVCTTEAMPEGMGVDFVGVDDSRIARQAFGRGLCILNERFVVGGSSPSTLSIYDLQESSRIAAVNLTMDIRNAIHGLEVWPYAE